MNASDYIADYVLALHAALNSTKAANDRPVLQSYLSAIAVIQAKVAKDMDVTLDIQQYERLLGHSWLADESVVSEISVSWGKFKSSF